MKILRVAALLAGVILMPSAAQAQATTFTACVVPKTGTLYLIKVDGAPVKCGQNHQQVTWESVPGVWGTVYYAGTAFGADPGKVTSDKLGCLPGATLVSGGYSVNSETEDVRVLASHPSTVSEEWFVEVKNNGTSSVGISIVIKCAFYTPPTP